MLVTAAVATHAIGDVRDPLFLVLVHDVARCVLVAAIAGVGSVIVRLVASGAFCVVVSVPSEVGTMIKGGRRPCVGAMATGASVLHALVEGIRGCLVATGASVLLCCPKGGVIEVGGFPAIGRVAAGAIHRSALVDGIRGPLVATTAMVPALGREHGMIEIARGLPLLRIVTGCTRVR